MRDLDCEGRSLLQEDFPGYQVVGVDYTETWWEASLHFATKRIMRSDPIRFYPLSPGDTEGTGAGYPIPRR